MRKARVGKLPGDASGRKELVGDLRLVNLSSCRLGQLGLGLVCELLNHEAGTTMINVTYKSVNAVMLDIIAGHISFGYA
jgi:hypothetical protein